jgi:hypothetical protein
MKKTMTEKEILEALGVPEETGWFQMVVAVLEQQEREAALQAQAPGTLLHVNAALVVAHCNGGAEWLRVTRERLQETREQEWIRKIKTAD